MKIPAVKIPASISTLLTAPSPAGLWKLRGDLLEVGLPTKSVIWSLLADSYTFLNELQAKSTAREYSHFASLLDVGAVGGIAIQNMMEGGKNTMWQRLIAGGLSEGLMVMAARQYVRAWEGEMNATYQQAAWNLYGALWDLSNEMQDNLPAGQRRQLIDTLLAPLHDEHVTGTVKAALIARLYQTLILVRLSS